MRRLILFNIIFLITGMSCHQPEESPSQKIKDLRALYDSYLYNYRDSLQWVENHENIKKKYFNNNSPAYREAINIAQKAYWRKPESIRIAFLDSLIKTQDFQQYHQYNRFTAYFVNARLNSQLGKTEEAIAHAIKADQILENNWDSYGIEKNKIRAVIFEAIVQYSTIEKSLIEMNEAYVDTLMKQKAEPDIEVIRNMGKIALSYSYHKYFSQSQVWVNKLLNLDYELHHLRFYSDLMFMKCKNFRNMNQLDSMKRVSNLMRNQFRTGYINEDIYRAYQALNLNNDAIIYGTKTALKVSDSLMNYFPNNCENKYLRLFLSNNRRQLYNVLGKSGQPEKEVFEALEFVQNCKKENADYWEGEIEVIDQLLSNYKTIDMNHSYLALMDRKLYLENSLHKMSQSLIALNNYLAGLENKNQNLKSEYELKRSHKMKLSFYIIFSLLILLALGFGYLLILHRKNNVYKKEILLKKNHLRKVKSEVQMKNENLSHIKDLLEERNVMLKNFAYQAAIDIKSPILVIQHNLEQISLHYKNIFQEENQAIVRYLNLSIQQLTTMIETLLEYSTKEKNIDKNEVVDVSEKLKRVYANLASQIKKKNAKITVAKNLPYVIANNSLIEKLFQNLISNALKYSKEDVPPEIHIGFEILNPYQVLFSVKDNGIGISKDHFKDIFQIFYKLDKQDKFEGNGIGLSICKKIVLEFEGKIWVESELHQGSTFYFTLPFYAVSKIENPLDESLSVFF